VQPCQVESDRLGALDDRIRDRRTQEAQAQDAIQIAGSDPLTLGECLDGSGWFSSQHFPPAVSTLKCVDEGRIG